VLKYHGSPAAVNEFTPANTSLTFYGDAEEFKFVRWLKTEGLNHLDLTEATTAELMPPPPLRPQINPSSGSLSG
jgi:hypothetical protein